MIRTSAGEPAPPGPASLPAAFRFGVPDGESLSFFGDEAAERAYRAAVERLVSFGGQPVPVDFTPFSQAAALLYQGPWVAERLAGVGAFFERNPDAVHPVVRGILEGARRYSAREAFEGSYRLAELRRKTEKVWQAIDALLVPTAPSHYTIEAVLADPVGLNTNLGTYTNFVNLLDLSALAVPAGFRENGLPFGVTLIGPAFADATLLELARRELGEPAPERRAAPPGFVWLAVAGAHLSGQPLNRELVCRGARLLRTTQTAPEYRLFALDTQPAKPGLVHAPEGPGTSIEVEVWELDQQAFGSFVAEIPPPMSIATTRLVDGSAVKGFSCEPHALQGAREISEYGGWRAFLSASGR